MFELIFMDRATDHVNYALTDISLIRYITSSEVGFRFKDGRPGSASFPQTEKLVVERIER